MPKKTHKLGSGLVFVRTAEVVRACDVSTRTAQNWHDKGLIAGYKIGVERRYDLDSLIAFMAERGIPMNEELEALRPAYRVVVGGLSEFERARLVRDVGKNSPGYEAVGCDCWGGVAVACHPGRVALILVSPELGRHDCLDWADHLKAISPGAAILYSPGDDELQPELFEKHGYVVVPRPIVAEKLSATLATLGRRSVK